MITRLVAKNYKQFTNLDLELHQTAILMGNNGSGKTSIFDILWGIRRLVVEGDACEDVFPITTYPRWRADEMSSPLQALSISLETPFGKMRYDLFLAHFPREGKSEIAMELLIDNGGPLYSFEDGLVHLYRDDYTAGIEFKVDSSRSFLAGLSPGEGNQKLAHFKEHLAKISCIRIDAPRMEARSEREELAPDREFTNFASWYRHAIQRDASAIGPFLEELREAVTGFKSLNLQALGQGFSLLQAKMARSNLLAGAASGKGAKSEYSLGFNELSDGQRALVALYAILHFLMDEGAIVCLDEPDSYLALEEIKPFVHRLLDEVEANNAQVIIASHHPSIYNTLAKDYGIKLTRDAQGNATAARYVAPEDSALPVAELVARGDLS